MNKDDVEGGEKEAKENSASQVVNLVKNAVWFNLISNFATGFG